MQNILILIGICVAVAVCVEIYRNSDKAPKEKVKEKVTRLTFVPIKGNPDNYKAIKRLNSYFEIIAFKGDSYSHNDKWLFVELYLYVNIAGKEKKFHALSKHINIKDLEAFINVLI